MNKRSVLLVVLVVLLVFPLVGLAEGPNPEPPGTGKPTDPGPPDEHPGKQDPTRAVPNLSFPLIATDIIQMFYEQTFVDLDEDEEWDDGEEWILVLDEVSGLPIPIDVTESITDDYDGSYAGYTDEDYHYAYEFDPVTGCAVDRDEDGVITDDDRIATLMSDWLEDNETWYDQPVYMDADYAYDPNLIWNVEYIDATGLGGANTWQADWVWETESVVTIDFIDWGNPMENINPIVGQRFPVEVAMYEKVAEWVPGAEGSPGSLADTSMTAYKMACLEYPGGKDELFGTSVLGSDPALHTFESAFATVLTNQFTAEVWNPDGTITSIELGPGIGPSGKMNFASASGGWIPKKPGWHRVWLHVNDPLISFSGAIVNNDEHYIMTSGCMVQELNPNKLELTGIVGNSTYIDVLVVSPSGNQ